MSAGYNNARMWCLWRRKLLYPVTIVRTWAGDDNAYVIRGCGPSKMHLLLLPTQLPRRSCVCLKFPDRWRLYAHASRMVQMIHTGLSDREHDHAFCY